VKHQVATLKVNSQGTWNMLERRWKDRGSAAQHERMLWRPGRASAGEDYRGNVNPIGLRMYDEASGFSEACTMAYHRERSRRSPDPNLHLRLTHPYDGRVSFIRQR
jgi:hypothetical protein